VGIAVAGTGAAHIERGVGNAFNLVQLAGSADLAVAKGMETRMAYDHQFPAGIRDEAEPEDAVNHPFNGLTMI
jgi:hypothetical protein